MSAPREDNAFDKLVKEDLTDRLETAEQEEGLDLKSTDDLIDHFKGRLGKVYDKWINEAPNHVLRELWREHQNRRARQTCHASSAQAPSLRVGGPSVPHSDSAYDPGSPMDFHPMLQESGFDAYFVPTAAPDANPRSLRARIDAALDYNIIDLDYAKSLCGDWVTEGARVLVGCRSTHDDPGGRNTKQIQCTVEQTKGATENVIFSKESPGFAWSDFHTEYPVGNSLSRKSSPGPAEFDRVEYQERRNQMAAELATRMADIMAKKDMKNGKRPFEEDDDGRQHPARRNRTRW